MTFSKAFELSPEWLSPYAITILLLALLLTVLPYVIAFYIIRGAVLSALRKFANTEPPRETPDQIMNRKLIDDERKPDEAPWWEDREPKWKRDLRRPED
ncbi:hypothetical protein ACVLV4_000720 [Rathayibacter agropyri]